MNNNTIKISIFLIIAFLTFICLTVSALDADLKIKKPGGSWEDDTITADVGEILDFRVDLDSNNFYLLLSIINAMPKINEDPMFDLIEGSVSPTPIPPNSVYADDLDVQWLYWALATKGEKTLEWRARIVKPGTGDARMAAAGVYANNDVDSVEDQVTIIAEGTDQPFLSFRPDYYDFDRVAKGETVSTFLYIKNVGSGTLTYSLDPQCSWLTLSEYSGSSTGEEDTIQIYVDTTNLDDGEHSCNVNIDSNDISAVFTVDIEVFDPNKPKLTFNPTGYYTRMLKNQQLSVTFDIGNEGVETLNYNIDWDCTWVGIIPTSGTVLGGGTERITVTVDSTGLDFGSHECIVSISSNGGSGTFAINIDVIPDQPILKISKNRHDFGDVLSGESVETSFFIWNFGTQILDFSIENNYDEISINPNSGSSSDPDDKVKVTVLIDTTNLQRGANSFELIINSNGGRETFNITMNILKELPPILLYSPVSFDFGDLQQGLKRNRYLRIWNAGEDTLYYNLYEDCKWLTIYPSKGQSDGERDSIKVTIDTTDLELGFYNSTIFIESNGGNYEIQVSVNIVMPPGLPYEPNPSDREKDISLNAILNWKTYENAETSYDVYLEAWDQNPSKLVSYNKKVKIYNHEGFVPNTHYYWRVVSDFNGKKVEGPVWDFWTTDQEITYNLDFVNPQNGIINFKGSIFQLGILKNLKTSIIIMDSINVEVISSPEIEKVEFVLKNMIRYEKNVDETPNDGFSCSFLIPNGKYNLAIYGYINEKIVSENEISNIRFIKI